MSTRDLIARRRMWAANGSSLVPRARIVECDRAKPSNSLRTVLRTPHKEVLAHVCPGLMGHFIVVDMSATFVVDLVGAGLHTTAGLTKMMTVESST